MKYQLSAYELAAMMGTKPSELKKQYRFLFLLRGIWITGLILVFGSLFWLYPDVNGDKALVPSIGFLMFLIGSIWAYMHDRGMATGAMDDAKVHTVRADITLHIQLENWKAHNLDDKIKFFEVDYEAVDDPKLDTKTDTKFPAAGVYIRKEKNDSLSLFFLRKRKPGFYMREILYINVSKGISLVSAGSRGFTLEAGEADDNRMLANVAGEKSVSAETSIQISNILAALKPLKVVI